ncbi:alpha/beta hydrolase family protein [Actinokineospora enzanensis]|uniref:alpha/beta hydrolase family protein n=1 Tax=Actinokineospora enzanensis TaxID=155975 RepID=UPI00038209C4|nr:hypothetical protein [Actinokineospora enzanensis]
MSTLYARVAGLTLVTALAAATPAVASTGGKLPITVPGLSGRYAVGTTDVHLVDRGRLDPWKKDRQREVMLTISYPSDGSSRGPRAPWMTAGTGPIVDQGAADAFGIPAGSADWGGALRQARTDARAYGRWPVVLFSPGFGGPRELNSSMVDDLASRGYVVVSMSHTFESAFVMFPGGRVETGVATGSDPVTAKTALDARVADSRFVLDQLRRLSRGDNPDAEHHPLPRGLSSALDLDHVGMFGHSYGGFTSAETMYVDRRVDAGIDLDGSLGTPDVPGQATQYGLDRPFMLAGSDLKDPETGQVTPHTHQTSLDPSWGTFWKNQRGWKRDLHLAGSEHYGYTDLQFAVPQLASVLPPGAREQLIGTIDPTRSVVAQHDYIGAFFDLHLKNCDRGLFYRDSPRYPDAHLIP